MPVNDRQQAADRSSQPRELGIELRRPVLLFASSYRVENVQHLTRKAGPHRSQCFAVPSRETGPGRPLAQLSHSRPSPLPACAFSLPVVVIADVQERPAPCRCVQSIVSIGPKLLRQIDDGIPAHAAGIRNVWWRLCGVQMPGVAGLIGVWWITGRLDKRGWQFRSLPYPIWHVLAECRKINWCVDKTKWRAVFPVAHG